MARILIVYASCEGHTERVAERIAAGLTGTGHGVDLRRADSAEASLDPASYDGVIVGASVHYGRHPNYLRALLRKHRPELAARPGAFFSVSLSAKERYANRFLRQVGWQPQLSATFAGALRYSRYGSFKRMVMMAFAAFAGHDTDSSQDHEYTDWAAVEHFSEACARRFSADLPDSRASSSRGDRH